MSDQTIETPQIDATTQTTEATPQDTSKPSADLDFDSKAAAERFQRLATLEKKKLDEKQKFISEKQAFENERSELLKYKEMVEKIKKNELSVLDEINPDYYTEATRYKLNNSEPTLDHQLKSLEDRMAKMFEEKLKAKEQEFISRDEENKKLQSQAIRNNWVKEINTYFNKTDEIKSKYPLMREVEGYEETILEAIEKTGVSVDEAAEKIEASIKQELKQNFLKHKELGLEWLLDEYGLSKEQFDKLTPKVKNEIKTEAMKAVGVEASKTLSNVPNSISHETPRTFKSKQESLDEVAKLIKIRKDT